MGSRGGCFLLKAPGNDSGARQGVRHWSEEWGSAIQG